MYRETVVSMLLKQEDTDGGALNLIADTLTGFGDLIRAISRF